MNTNNRRAELRFAAMALLAGSIGGSLILTSPVLAQPPPSSGGPVSESLTVTAPKVVRREAAAGARLSGAPIEVLSFSKAVDFSDLDLTRQAGVDEFRKRIMYASLAACDAIEAEYPSNIYVPVPAAQNCPDRTATQAFSLMDEIVGAARAHAQ